LIDRHGAAAVGQTDPHADLTRGQRSLHAAVNLPHADFIHHFGFNSSPFDGAFSSRYSQIPGRHIFKAS
jgi:hypothetical protein